MSKYELIDGTALVITGPVGSGKTLLAREIAERYGRFSTISGNFLKKPNAIRDILAGKPDVVIIDEHVSKSDVVELKALIASPTVRIIPKNSEAIDVKTPKFILCTGSIEPLAIDEDDRRFRIVQL